ncbi:MAG TPA: PilW family protein [Gammaproteobacteria bacterium]|jgi:type IV pilus assembly protein PilW
MKIKQASRQTGISMVEVLVALVISLFLLSGIVQVYLGNKTAYRFTEAVARIQENGRFAIESITQDLRMAGFFGCAMFDPEDTSNIVNNLNPSGAGYDAALHDFVLAGIINGTEGDGLNFSDSITLKGSKAGQLNIIPPFNVNTSADIFVTSNSIVKPDDIVMVSNCRGADIFQVTNATISSTANKMAVIHNTGAGSPGNYNPDNCQGGNAHCLSQSYGADAALFRLQSVSYAIAAGASGEPALWRSENGVSLELVEGVEEMQMLYGVDTDDDDFANQFVTIDQVADTFDIVSVRVMLLLRSTDDFVAEENQTYSFNGNLVNAADTRLRQEFTTTIALRNRVGAS